MIFLSSKSFSSKTDIPVLVINEQVLEIAWEIQHISLSPEHFHVKNLGAALSVIALQDHRWHIHFPFSFKKNKSYTLEIDSLQLENGQWIPSQSVPFVWDTQKPKLFSWHLFADSLLLTFNEPVILPPKSSVSVIPENKLDKLQQISESSLFLRFADSMPQETIIQLSLAIQDLQGNLSEIKSEIDWDIRPPRLHGYYLLSADSLVLQLNEPAYFPALKPENFSLGGLTPVFIDQFRDAEEILLVFSRKLLCLDSALTARNIFDRKFNKQEYISTKISAHLPFTAHVQFLNARQTWVRFSQDMYRSSYSQDINLSGEIFMEKLEWLNSREMLITWKKEAAKGKSYELDLKRLLNLKTKSLVNPIQKIVFSPFLKEIETDEPYLHLHYREALAQQPLPADKFLWGTYAPSAAVINKNRLSLLFDEFPRNSQRIQVPRLRTASYRCTEPIDSLLFVDRLPPRLDSLTSSFINEITLHFNEAVDFTDVSFQISSEALLSALEKDGQQIRLRFEKLEERQYELSLHSLTDLYGNAFPDTVISFFFRQPVFAEMHQIQLNELMVKTLDKKSHRGTQYAELFNSSNRPFNLRGYRISDRSKSAELNEYILKPGAFVVLCPASKTSYFDKHTSVLGVSSFPVFNQTNEFIRLENPLKKTVDEISYEKEWESIWVKGESIEQINPEYLCSDMSNWESCVDFRRGTPGKPNSVHSSEKKTQAPELLEIYAPSSQKVKLLFDQPIYTDSSTQATGSVPAAAFYADSSNRHVLWIALETTLDFIPQQLSVSNLYNCYGIAANFPEIPFRRLSIPSRDQILFNEILTTETEFVELYNSSDQAFDLSQLKLLKDTLAFEEATAITQETVLLKPKNYLALTRDKTSLLYLYPDLPDESRILESRQIPNLGKDEDALYLVNSRGNVVDAMEYDDSFYRFNFSDGQFRSLEKINPEAESNDARNWSASTAANNYGTPGYANATHLTPEYGDELFISPEYLSISNLHKNRLISMTWQHEKPGWQLSASIYTANGREVIDLTQNEFAGKQTVITWQGEESSGNMVRPGIYLVLVKAYHPDGDERQLLRKVYVVE